MTKRKTRSDCLPIEERRKHQKEAGKRWLELNPERRKAVSSAWRQRNQGAVNDWAKKQRQRLRDKVQALYGGACTCCGEQEKFFLTIDHVYRNGRAHRKELKNSNDALYRLLLKSGAPLPEYRLLCYNCNCGRERNGGVCPHRR